MADKNIGSLPTAAALDDDSLLLAEQQGQAVHFRGKLLKDFAAAAARGYAEAAGGFAKAAGDHAEVAEESREAIENMEVEAVTLADGQSATVEKETVDGVVKLTFGLPKGKDGNIAFDDLTDEQRALLRGEIVEETLAEARASANAAAQSEQKVLQTEQDVRLIALEAAADALTSAQRADIAAQAAEDAARDAQAAALSEQAAIQAKEQAEAFAKSVPSVTDEDEGKMLGVVDGEMAWTDAPSGLPEVTGDDNGKVLTVVGGKWAADEFSAETSKSTVVMLSAGGWTQQSNGRYTQSVAVSFMTADAPVVSVDVYMSGSDPDADDMMEEAYLGNVYRMTQGASTVTFWARNIPDVNIQVSVGVS